jgi:hypothetical protein
MPFWTAAMDFILLGQFKTQHIMKIPNFPLCFILKHNMSLYFLAGNFSLALWHSSIPQARTPTLVDSCSSSNTSPPHRIYTPHPLASPVV